MPADQVAALAPYLPRLASLKMSEKAAAIHLGRFPGETPPEEKQTVVAAPRLQVDRATLTPSAPAQTFAQVQAAAAAGALPRAPVTAPRTSVPTPAPAPVAEAGPTRAE